MGLLKFSFGTGIQKDGPLLNDGACLDGNWVYFNTKGNPSSMGGYKYLNNKSGIIYEGNTADSRVNNIKIFNQDLYAGSLIKTIDTALIPFDMPWESSGAELSALLYKLPKKTKSGLRIYSNTPVPFIDFSHDYTISDKFNSETIAIIDKQTKSTGKRYVGNDDSTVTISAPGIVSFSAKIWLYDYSLILKEIRFTLPSKITVVGKDFQDRVEVEILGTTPLEDGTSSDVTETVVLPAGGDKEVESINTYITLKDVIRKGQPANSDEKINLYQSSIVYAKDIILATPARIFVNAYGSPGVGVKVKGVDYFTGSMQEELIASNDSSADESSIHGNRFYSYIESITLAVPYSKAFSGRDIAIGLRDFALLKNFIVNNGKVSFKYRGDSDVLNAKNIQIIGDQNSKIVDESFPFTNNVVSKNQYSNVKKAYINLYMPYGKESFISINIPDPVVFALDISLAIPTPLIFSAANDSAIESFIVGMGSILADGSTLTSDAEFPPNTGTFSEFRRITSLAYKRKDESKDSSFTANVLSESSGNNLLPRSVNLFPSTKTIGQWHLITGFDPSTLNTKFNTVTDCVTCTTVDEQRLQVVGSPRSILSEEYQLTNKSGVSYCFDTIIIAKQSILLIVPREDLQAINSNTDCYFVSFVDLASAQNGIKSLPLSLSKGVDINNVTPLLGNRIYCKGLIVAYPFVFFYDYSDWDYTTSKAKHAPGYIAISHDLLIAPEKGNAIWEVIQATSTPIIHGTSIRNNSNNISCLFWSLDSLIEVSYNTVEIPLVRNVISNSISILSAGSVVEVKGLFFWIGVDNFYVYNGQVSTVDNNQVFDYFFNNIDMNFRQKVWGAYIDKLDSIIWHYIDKSLPGANSECNAYILYSITTHSWSSGYFPVTSIDQLTYNPYVDPNPIISKGRSCGIKNQLSFPYPIWWENTKSTIETGSCYRPFLHEYEYDHVMPSQTIIPLQAPIYSFVESGMFSCMYGQSGAEAEKKTDINSLQYNIKGQGVMAVEVRGRNFLWQEPQSNAGKALINNAQALTYSNIASDYMIILPSKTHFALPQQIASDRSILILRKSADPTSFIELESDNRICIYLDAVDKELIFYIVGTYDSKVQQETIRASSYSRPILLGSKLFKTVTSITYTNCSKDNVVSVGFEYPSKNQPVVGEIAPLNNLSSNWFISMKESHFFVSFCLKKYSLKSYYEIGAWLFSLGFGEERK